MKLFGNVSPISPQSTTTTQVMRLVFVCFLATAFLSYLLPYQYNGDGIAYLYNAEQFLHGNLEDAVLGPWGPLYSLLLAPLLLLPIDPLIATKVLAVALSILCTLSVYMLSGRFPFSPNMRLFIAYTTLPTIALWSYIITTPDVLFTALICLYLWLTFPVDRIVQKPRYAALVGIVAGLSFLAKAYALPFFIAHLLCILCYHRYANKGKAVPNVREYVRAYAVALATCAFLISPWVALVSVRHDALTVNTAAAITRAAMAPTLGADPSTFREPVFDTYGLVQPTNPAHPHYLVDSESVPYTYWSPFDSLLHFRYFLNDLWQSIVRSITALLVTNAAVLLLLVGIGGWYLYRQPRRFIESYQAFFITITTAVFVGGYLLVWVQTRYLLPVYPLLLIGTILALQDLLRRGSALTKRAVRPVLLVILFSSCVVPVYEIAFNDLVQRYDKTHAMSLSILEQGITGSNIASNDLSERMTGISFVTQNHYHGIPLDREDHARVVTQLREHDIRYYFVWDPKAFEKDLGDPFEVAYTGTLRYRNTVDTLTIYTLRE